MTTKQELKAWSKKFSGVKTEVEREEFKKNLHASLSKRDEASLTAGLFAVKEFAREVCLEAEKKAVSIEQLETIHQNKTGALVCAAARTGAIIGEAGESEFNAVSNYASSLGLLFQITDDLLDVTQTTEILGKTAGKDVSAEKATYPAIYGLDETRRLAKKVHFQAIDSLKNLNKDTNLLKELADFILERKK